MYNFVFYVLAKNKLNKKGILQILKRTKKQMTSESNNRVGLPFSI